MASAELIDRIIRQADGLDPDLVRAQLQRFDGDYLDHYDPPAIARHLRAMHELSSHRPVVVEVSREADEPIRVMVVGFDHPFEFSSITGLLAGTGFSIVSSDAITLGRVRRNPSRLPGTGRLATVLRRHDPMQDGLIVDEFHGTLVGPVKDFTRWSRIVQPLLVEVMTLLDEQEPASIEKARRLVIERVTDWLRQHGGERSSAALVPIEVETEPLPHATRLRLRAPDAPAFLYALSTSLALHELEIVRTRIRTVEGRVVDEIDLVSSRGKQLQEPARVQDLRLSVLLTQQCTYFLDQSPDPFTALRRFEELSEKIVRMPDRAQWLELLAHPSSMRDLAKVLGASDYLWEDFIKLQAEALLPVFRARLEGRTVCPPSRSLPRRLDEAIGGAKRFDEQRRRLNEFKDRELFLIDLDHVLREDDPDVAFVVLSDRLVQLAENLVATSARLVYAELIRLYGSPLDSRRKPVSHAIFGLGKLGGMALGYASDIELLFMFSADGKTKGGTRGAMPNDEFFAIFTRETCDYIQAKREGIFQVDLRLRPYGRSGPLATSREQFKRYYSQGGEAHPFERLALVRLRWITGDAKLGFEIEHLRDGIIYDGPAPSPAPIWEVSEKMRKQHLEGRKLNSKYSPGALTDLETTVQLLQVAHAREAPQLRTSRLHDAIEGLRRAGVLSSVEYDDLMAAYQFLRRLINAQRLLRGSAQDLFIPPAGLDELMHLARRMNYVADEEHPDVAVMLLKDFARHTKTVQSLARRVRR